jgi:hypothetical protein
MTDASDAPDFHDDPMYRELTRIFGDLELEGSTKLFFLLPLVSEDDALAFLRTVPSGTPWADLASLAADYRATHPSPGIDPSGSDQN